MSKHTFLKLGEAGQMHNFITANSFLESVITMIKDERLNHKLSLSSFMDTLDQLKSFYEGSV